MVINTEGQTFKWMSTFMRHYKLNSLPENNYLLLVCILLWLKHDISCSRLLGYSWLGLKKKKSMKLNYILQFKNYIVAKTSHLGSEHDFFFLLTIAGHERSNTIDFLKLKYTWFNNVSGVQQNDSNIYTYRYIYIVYVYIYSFPLYVTIRYWI